MKAPIIFKSEDFRLEGTSEQIALDAQEIFEKWYQENVWVPDSKSQMKRVIIQTDAKRSVEEI